MRLSTTIAICLYYVLLVVGLPASTCECCCLFASSDQSTSRIVYPCCGGESGPSCCVISTNSVHLGDDHTSAKAWIPESQKFLSALHQVHTAQPMVPERTIEIITESPPPLALTQSFSCSFLL